MSYNFPFIDPCIPPMSALWDSDTGPTHSDIFSLAMELEARADLRDPTALALWILGREKVVRDEHFMFVSKLREDHETAIEEAETDSYDSGYERGVAYGEENADTSEAYDAGYAHAESDAREAFERFTAEVDNELISHLKAFAEWLFDKCLSDSDFAQNAGLWTDSWLDSIDRLRDLYHGLAREYRLE